MSEKRINGRIQHKHDVEANWNKATNFAPKEGELIIYDVDETHSYVRIKVGDGETNVNSLPFVSTVQTGGDITVGSDGKITVNDDSHNHTVANITGLQAELDALNVYKQVAVAQIKEDGKVEVVEEIPAETFENKLTLAAGSSIKLVPDTENKAIIIDTAEGLATKEYVNTSVSQKSQVQIITWEEDD